MTKAEKIFQNMLKAADQIILTHGTNESKAQNFAIRFDTTDAGDGFHLPAHGQRGGEGA